ncbi:hypothetical protein G3I15_43185 [Streptomyces sp. SID10244]|nr:hypothetical protein [Streptomyces sp. SID10244]
MEEEGGGVNKRLDMPVLGFVAALIGSFLVGALAVWIAFGFTWTPDTKGLRGWLYDLISSPGNVSAWLAAAGTWVIGYGAWKYAREAHNLRMREVMIQQQNQLEAELSTLDHLKYRIDICTKCAALIDGIQINEDKVDRIDVIATCETIALVVKTLDLIAPSSAVLDAEALDGLNALRVAVSNFLEVGEGVRQQLEALDKEYVPKLGRMRELWSDAESIGQFAAAAVEGIDRRAVLLRERMNS